MVNFFDVTFSIFYCALLLFYTKVQKLNKIYKEQTTILPLAIDYYTKIITGNYTNINA